jgi:archaellum component FlaC
MSGNENEEPGRYGGVVGNEDEFTLSIGGEEVGIDFPHTGGEADGPIEPDIDHDEIARRVADLIDLPEIPDDYARQEDLDDLYNELEDLNEQVDNIDEASTDELESIADEYRDLLSNYREVLDDLEGLDIPGTPAPDPEIPETSYLTEIILGIAEEYERSSSRLEDMRELHNDNMSDDNVSDILYD